MIRPMSRAWYLAVMITLIIGVGASQASESARQFLDGVSQYNNGLYTEAASTFQTLADAGIVNGKLYYNIGNAYFKAGQIGHAILWYERAIKLIPGDPDLTFNYSYVKEFVQDKSEETVPPLIKVLFFWKTLMGKNTIRWAGIAFFMVFFGVASVRLLRGKPVMTGLQFVLLGIASILILTACYDYYDDAYNHYAIILPETISVRSGLNEGATELFVLHVGTKVSVLQARRDYIKIRFSDGKIGWMKKSDAGII